MNLTVIKPVVFNRSMLVSSTAAETVVAWSAGSYALGATARRVVTKDGRLQDRIFESQVAANTADPAVGTNWVDIGPSNKEAMFDNKISTQTDQAGSDPLIVEIEPLAIINTVGLVNANGINATIEVYEGATQTFEQTIPLSSRYVDNWYDYFTLPFDTLSIATFTGVPAYQTSNIRITVDGELAAIGHCTFGRSVEIGEVEHGATSGIIDYSRKETDEYGDTLLVERGFADESSFQVVVFKENLNKVKRLLRDIRATPVLWIASDDAEYNEVVNVFGWYRTHSIAISYPTFAMLDIEIEGLT